MFFFLLEQGTSAAQHLKAGTYLVVGTALISPRGEEAPPAGRVLVFAILPVDPDASAGDDTAVAAAISTGVLGWRLHLVSENEFGGVVSCLAPLHVPPTPAVTDRHHVVAGLGRQLVVLEWNHRPAEGRFELRFVPCVVSASRLWHAFLYFSALAGPLRCLTVSLCCVQLQSFSVSSSFVMCMEERPLCR
jgi:hypothetical protein